MVNSLKICLLRFLYIPLDNTTLVVNSQSLTKFWKWEVIYFFKIISDQLYSEYLNMNSNKIDFIKKKFFNN